MYIQILIDIVFGLTAVSTFYFWLKANKTAWKYKRYWPFLKKHMTPDERLAVTKYQKWQFVSFFGWNRDTNIFNTLGLLDLQKVELLPEKSPNHRQPLKLFHFHIPHLPSQMNSTRTLKTLK